MNKNHRLYLFAICFLIFSSFGQMASADYASLRANDCTMLYEYTESIGPVPMLMSPMLMSLNTANFGISCSPYTIASATAQTSIQLQSSCINGDIQNPRFDIFTYSGVRGAEVGGSTLYQAGWNDALFPCNGLNWNVGPTFDIPIGQDFSGFVAVSNSTSPDEVRNYFENGVGNFEHALIHFNIKIPTAVPYHDPVIILPGILGSAEQDGVWVMDPIFHTYDDLIATLEANGYTDGTDLFTMPYDWHESNIVTATKLRDKINDVQDICGCQKVDIVAHSMGGLVARQYIQSDYYENDVDQLIFLGTPHLGSVFSYLTWEGGETGTKTGTYQKQISDQLLKFFLTREAQKAGYSSLFNYIQNKPITSLEELLPIFNYLNDKSTDFLRKYPDNYPQNTFLENLKIGVGNLFNRVNITNIVGELGATSTLRVIRVIDSPNPPLWENGYPDGYDGSIADRGFLFGYGDGTVPIDSSEFIGSGLTELPAEHNSLPTKAEGLVYNKLTGLDATTLITSNTDSFFDTNFKFLIIKILSPVDILVTAPNGKKIGKDFQNNTEINEIGGAFYSGFLTDDEYVTIPNPLDGEYKIEARGTGSGEYTIATDYISNDFSVDKDFIGQTQPGQITNLELGISNSGIADIKIAPTDITPPSINIISPINKDYLRSEFLPINVVIADSDSGILSQTIKFDDKIVNNGQVMDLFFEKLGLHSLFANATDNAGNAASTQTNFRITTSIESTISDVERAYTLGWITKKDIKNELVEKLKSALKKPEDARKLVKLNKKFDKELGKELLKELTNKHPKYINDLAYNLLKEDINWLLNN